MQQQQHHIHVTGTKSSQSKSIAITSNCNSKQAAIMGGFEWNCHNCTYHHRSHATRCQMCNELRVSREEMRSFVTGGGRGRGGGAAGTGSNTDGSSGSASAAAAAAVGGRPAQQRQSQQSVAVSHGGPSSTMSAGPGASNNNNAIGAGPQRQQQQQQQQQQPVAANPYLASRRPMTANNNNNNDNGGAGAAKSVGGTGVLNPYASANSGASNAASNVNTANVGNRGVMNANAAMSNVSGGGRGTTSGGTTIGIGIGNSGTGPTNNNVMGGTAGRPQQNNIAGNAMMMGGSVQQRPASGNPYNPHSGQQQQQSHCPGSSGGGSGAGGGGAMNNSRMNPPPPRQQQLQQQGPRMGPTTNNPHQRQQQQQQYFRPNQQQQQQQQQSQNRGPFNPYVQSANTNNNNNRRKLPAPPQQQRQTMGPGVTALLANRSQPGGGANQQQQQRQQNPWTVAQANAATKQSLQYRPGPVPLDEEAAKTWIYPNNPTHPLREYQLRATEDAIMRNTLVSLPTGLGKTLIAAVTMYNFYRWFPTGKVVFCAPTKPLVSQQLTSCYEIMGVPAEHTAEIMGETVDKDARARYWAERRLFFCTPQTIDNDIDAGRCDPKSIVCVVIDEAHRAKGKYAYVKVIQKILQSGAKFRVLALSATPGTTQKAIGEVVENLLISNIFAKSDEDADVKKYIHNREEDVILVTQTEAIVSIERLLDGIISPHLEKLRSSGAIPTVRGSIATIASQRLREAQDEYNARIGKTNNSLTSVFRVVCLLIDCRIHIRASGISTTRRSLESMQQQSAFGKITKSEEFQALWREVEKLTIGGGGDDHAANLKANNPKLQKLDEVLCEHFGRAKSSGESSKVIVFTELRDTIRDILSVIECRRPLVRPHMFIGQGQSSKKGGADDDVEDQNDMAAQGMKQKQQQEVIKRFRQGDYNVLVATSIGEEGLDIGEVDLIVNFTTSRSCTRMIQRMGRTGRKRQGRVISLVSEGKEQNDRQKAKSDQARLNRILKEPAKAKDLLAKITMRPALIPGLPSKQMQDMNIVAEAFRMSQVAGHSQKKKKRRNANGSARGRNTIDDGSWRLRPSQEKDRAVKFGSLTQTDRYSSNPLSSKPSPFPIKLRREYIRKRSSKMTETSTSGTSSSILSKMEAMFLDSDKTGKAWQRRARLNRRKKKQSSSRDRVEKGAEKSAETIPEREFTSRLMAARDHSPEKDASHANLMEEDDDDANVFMMDEEEDVSGWNYGSFGNGNTTAPDTIGASGGQNNAGPLDDVFGSMQDMSIQDPGGKSSSRLSSNVLNSIFSEIDGEGRTVLPPPTLDGSSGMYFMEEYQSPEGSEDDASERLDTPTRDVGVFAMNIDATKPPALDLPLPLPQPESSIGFHENGGNDDDDLQPHFEADDGIDGDGNNNSTGELDGQVDDPNTGSDQNPKNGEAKISESCEIQININTDDSSSSSSDEDDSEAEESEAKAGKGGIAEGECNHPRHDDANDDKMQEKAAPSSPGHQQEASDNPPSDIQVPESVFVPIDLEALRAQGVRVNASPQQEFRVSIATQESSSSDSSSSSSCSNADEDLEDTKTSDLHHEANANEDSERISPKAIAATGDPEFPSQSQSSTKSSDSVASLAAEQVEAAAAARPFTDLDNGDSASTNSSSKLPPSSGRQPNKDGLTIERRVDNTSTIDEPVKDASNNDPDVDMECVDTAKPASAPNPSLTDSVDCTPMVFRKGKQQSKGGAGAGQRRKVLFSPESISTQESVTKSAAGRRISKPVQNHNLSAAQGLLDTPDKSVAGKEECDDIVCAICHCFNSPDSDPIVLCDGDGNDGPHGSCNLAVHKSCYNIGPSLDMIDEWRCDRCQDSASNAGSKPACSICRQTGGALQRTPCDEAWVHSVCVFWSSQYANMLLAKAKSVPEDGFCGDLCTIQSLSEASFGWVPPVRCNFCSKDRAVKCYVSGCQASAHPFCATDAKVPSSRWTLLHHKGETDGAGVDVASSRLWWHMFCPDHTDEAIQALKRFRLLPQNDDNRTEQWTRPCLKCIYYRGRGENIPLCTGCDGGGDRSSNEKNGASRKRRLRKKSDKPKQTRNPSNDSMEIDLTIDTSRKRLKGSPEKKSAGKSGKDKLRERVSVFFDTEAAIDSDEEDGSDEERELRALEEDELSHDSFINDSSQLGSCSQDDLDRIREKTDTCAPSRHDVNDATLHRELDARREREQEFATPMLNRRNKNRSTDDDLVGLSQSVDSSQRGLGNMAFIRSVLEHHKAGGDCDQIENEYHRLAQEAEVNSADAKQQESQDMVIIDSAPAPAPQPQMDQTSKARAPAASVPPHQQGPGQGRPPSSKASSSFFAPRQKTSARSTATTAASSSSMPLAPSAPDPWEAHATANRREAGIAIPMNNPNIGSRTTSNKSAAAPRHHGTGNRAQGSNHLFTSSASMQPPRSQGTSNRPPFPPRQNTNGPPMPSSGGRNGLAPAANNSNRPQSSGGGGGGKSTGLTDEQRARMEENRRKALLRKQQRQQQMQQGYQR